MLVAVPSPWILVLHRFLNVIFGIFIALQVSIFIWPSRAREHLQKGLAKVLMDCGQIYRLLFDSYLKGDYQEEAINHLRIQIKQTFLQNRDLLNESLKELGRVPSEDEALSALMIYEEKIIEYILAMDDAILNTQGDTFQLKLEHQLNALAQTTATAFSRLAEAMTIRWPQLQLTELNSAVVAVDEQLFALRKVGASQRALST
jgi:uncharacterized membrane protein YccC